MAVTQFSSADMIPALEALAPAESFLNRTFFPRESYFTGRFCQVDSKKARRWIAPIVKRGQIGRVVAREPITTRFFEVPEVRPTRETAVTDLDDRLMGESAYSRRSGAERLAEIVAADIVDLVGAVTRRVEKMTSDLLFGGAISYLLDDGSTETLSYGTITPIVPATPWDGAGDPIADLSAAAATIISASGLVPDMVVMGVDALSAFLANTKVADQLNRLHIVAGGISPAAPEGIGTAQFIGTLYRPYVKLYGYSESYEDESTNALKPMIADDTVLLGCSKSPATTSYGSVTQVEQDGETRSYSDLKYVPRRLSAPREDRIELRIASRPCLIPFDLASWAVLKPVPAGLMARERYRDERREKERKTIMNASTTYTQTLSPILGAEPFPTTTFSLDIPAGGGQLKAGHAPYQGRGQGCDGCDHVRHLALRHGRHGRDFFGRLPHGQLPAEADRGREHSDRHRRRLRRRIARKGNLPRTLDRNLGMNWCSPSSPKSARRGRWAAGKRIGT